VTIPSHLFLARRTVAGDEYAFACLVDRYEWMIRGIIWEIAGQSLDDARQVCLLALHDACHAVVEDPRRSLSAAARVRMRSRVGRQWEESRGRRAAPVTQAVPFGDEDFEVDDGEGGPVPIDERSDPALICETRDRLRRTIDAFHQLTPAQQTAMRRPQPQHDPTRRYQVRRHRAHKRLRQLVNEAEGT